MLEVRFQVGLLDGQVLHLQTGLSGAKVLGDARDFFSGQEVEDVGLVGKGAAVPCLGILGLGDFEDPVVLYPGNVGKRPLFFFLFHFISEKKKKLGALSIFCCVEKNVLMRGKIHVERIDQFVGGITQGCQELYQGFVDDIHFKQDGWVSGFLESADAALECL